MKNASATIAHNQRRFVAFVPGGKRRKSLATGGHEQSGETDVEFM